MKRLILFVLLVCVNVVAASAQDAPLPPELEAQLAELEQATRSIRSLDGETVDRDFPSREETIAYLGEVFERQLPPEEAERYQRFYVALDLLEPEIDLADVYLNLLGSQVAGFYDSDTKVMNVLPVSGEITDSLSFTEQIVYVHEYTHALQDQFFDLNRLLENEMVAANPDQSLAVLALVEGDATAVMNVFTQRVVQQNPLAGFAMLTEGLQAGNLVLPPDIPPILVRELLLPYEAGLNFVVAVFTEGGWEAVNDAYSNPPTMTAAILHPERYLRGDVPADVTLSGAEDVLGEDWARIWDTTLGEWYLREHLRTQVARDVAFATADGWNGDRLHIYHRADDDALALVLRVSWLDEVEAEDFADVYSLWADERFDGAGTEGCWADDTEALCLSQQGVETLVTHAPTVDLARELLAAQLAPAPA